MSCSQTSRATNCATPRSVKNIRFLGLFRKWSNLWSKHFVGVFLKRVTPEKVNVFKGFRAFEKTRSGKCLHAPKASALPIAPHLDIYLITPARPFASLTTFSILSQSLRAAVFEENSAHTSRCVIFIQFLGQFCKRSNLWSSSIFVA